MEFLYKSAIICCLCLSINTAITSGTYQKVKIQSVSSGTYMGVVWTGSPSPPVGFSTRDSVTWKIDWENGVSDHTYITTTLNGERYNVRNMDSGTGGLELQADIDLGPLDGQWKIVDAHYYPETGRYHYKFAVVTSGAPTMLCINGPEGIPDSSAILPALGEKFKPTPCHPDEKRQEFFITKVEE